MRTIYLIMIIAGLTACKKESAAPTEILAERVDTGSSLIGLGMFQNGPYGTVSGSGQVVKNANGSYSVVLDSFMTSNGPDLYVYLSKQRMPVDFIEVGKLRSTSGKQVYPVSSTMEISDYPYVCIHCKSFNHLFGSAQWR